jgi:hypothetical protein
MNVKNWKDLAELIGIAAIVASLLFVGMQMRLDREIAEAQAYMDSSNGLIELSQLTSENQDIWINGLDGADLTLAERSKFEQIVRAWYVRKVAQWQRANRLNAGNPQDIVEAFAYELYMHSGLREHFRRYVEGLDARRTVLGGERSTTSFTASVERALAQIEREAPPIPEDKTYFIF